MKACHTKVAQNLSIAVLATIRLSASSILAGNAETPSSVSEDEILPER